ncbi:MAG: PSD1 and planctomycete cytochrome C domain-containing protein [Planctomycetaceae bacterium]
MLLRSALVLLVCAPFSCSILADDGAGSLRKIEFNRDIRPLLSDNCFACHGPDRNKREADLRLDTQAGLHGEGGAAGAIVPGQPAESKLIQRVTSGDTELVMPPPETGKSLSADQIELLRLWISQGGEFQGHWSFLPIAEVEDSWIGRDAKKAAERIDRHVQQERSALGLSAASEADRVTLLRRLSLDLTGLPPEPDEVDAFVADQSADAWERAVDRLLASPHYGERMAMWWLDLVRYADSVGYHGDQEVSVSPFREYVIAAFNDNKTFDRFTIEQLAGDLLPSPTLEHRIASGYNRLGMMSAEGGVQPKEYLAKYISERVRNATGTWLGITLGCAECHDHKFDPLTTRDFYRFEAFFADIRERGLYSGANSDGNWGPFVRVPTLEQSRHLAELDGEIAMLKSTLSTETPELAALRETWERDQANWVTLEPQATATQNGTELKRRSDGMFLAAGPNPATDSYVLEFSSLPPGITAFRIDVAPDDSLPRKGVGRASNGNFVLTEFRVEVRSDNASELISLRNAAASFEQTGAADRNPYGKWSAAGAIDNDAKGAKWGWAVMEQALQPHYAVFETALDLTVAEGARLVITLDQNHDNPGHNLGCFRLSVSTAKRPVSGAALPPAEIAAILAVPSAERSTEQQAKFAAWHRGITSALEPVRQRLKEIEGRRTALEATMPTTLVTEAVEPRMVRILPRGNWMDDSGDAVTPAIPAVLASEPAADRRLTRLDLAEWLVSGENPLTARVTVNRLWKLFFGAGLSRRLDDLGAQGEWPSHPELLDYLAVEFRRSGWNMKHLIRCMLLTQVYRQSSLADAVLRERDPDNRWLARQGRFRLDAESVRDNALAVSGLLVRRVGGRSVRPYQPAGYWAYLNFPTREWQNGNGEELYRRGLYTHWQRQYLHPSLLAFDAPSREECTADRNRSNTPLQSLVLLNDPSYVEAAKVFAERILREGGGDDAARVDYAFRRAMSRAATAEERGVVLQLLGEHRTQYVADAAAAEALLGVGSRPSGTDVPRPELAAWTSVARVLLNLHEVITRN